STRAKPAHTASSSIQPRRPAAAPAGRARMPATASRPRPRPASFRASARSPKNRKAAASDSSSDIRWATSVRTMPAWRTAAASTMNRVGSTAASTSSASQGASGWCSEAAGGRSSHAASSAAARQVQVTIWPTSRPRRGASFSSTETRTLQATLSRRKCMWGRGGGGAPLSPSAPGRGHRAVAGGLYHVRMTAIAFPNESTTLLLPGPAGALEVAVDLPEPADARPLVAVVCHPLPTEGGTMHNKVVTMVARALRELGATTVRFNFRGTGDSEGEFDHGVGEREDLRAVVEWVRATHPGHALWLAGFSFGSFVTLSSAAELQPDALVSIAPPAAGRG